LSTHGANLWEERRGFPKILADRGGLIAGMNALMMFNDVILRTAFERGVPVIDLRLVCTEPSDYANPIEPSGQGGRKIADAIVCALGLSHRCATASHFYSGR
jgi:hypothetical protein